MSKIFAVLPVALLAFACGGGEATPEAASPEAPAEAAPAPAEGDAAAMAPIDYTRLVFAVALGYFLFGDVPNGVTMLGAAIVIAATLYITLRELKLGVKREGGGND